MAAAGRGATLDRPGTRPVDDGVDLRAMADVRPARETASARPVEELVAPLFSEEEGRQLRTRWEQIQTGFVDEPRRAVERADTLVAEVMKRLAEVFADERSQLESQWTRGDDVSTEDLRIALRRYRSFFDRLLAV